MPTETLIEPLTSDINFRIAEAERMLTPSLLIDSDRVQHNITGTLRLLGGEANRWRPHVKTTKLGYFMRMLVDAGIGQMKCATSLELSVAIESGATDVLVAYPLVGANAQRVRQIAEQNPHAAVSVLVENDSQIAQWRGAPVGIFIDVNPGMNRTGVPEMHLDAILHLSRVISASGLSFRGLHYYDGHLSKYVMAERCAQAHPGYEHLMNIADALIAAGVEVPEVVTAGSAAVSCALWFLAVLTP